MGNKTVQPLERKQIYYKGFRIIRMNNNYQAFEGQNPLVREKTIQACKQRINKILYFRSQKGNF